MNPEAKNLVRGILTRVRDLGGSASRTKLLKLMYLADINYYRATGRTLTGADWIYFHFGPWSSEYDALLEQMQAEATITMEPWAGGGLEGEQVRVVEPLDLNGVIESVSAYYLTLRAVDRWAGDSISGLLDYVYFETEPMRDAVKRQRLDFSRLARDFPPTYRLKPSGAAEGEIARRRRQASAIAKRQLEKSLVLPQLVDDELVEALAVMSADAE